MRVTFIFENWNNLFLTLPNRILSNKTLNLLLPDPPDDKPPCIFLAQDMYGIKAFIATKPKSQPDRIFILRSTCQFMLKSTSCSQSHIYSPKIITCSLNFYWVPPFTAIWTLYIYAMSSCNGPSGTSNYYTTFLSLLYPVFSALQQVEELFSVSLDDGKTSCFLVQYPI